MSITEAEWWMGPREEGGQKGRKGDSRRSKGGEPPSEGFIKFLILIGQ